MTTVRTRSLVGTLLALSAGAAGAESLCRLGEETVFACTTGHPERKDFSLCAAPMNATRPEQQWLQFRVGLRGKVEQSYPHERAGSLQRFEGSRTREDDRMSYVFINGTSLHELKLEQLKLDRPLFKTPIKAELVIQNGKQKTTSECSDQFIGDYWAKLAKLAPLTRQPAGAENSLVTQFGQDRSR